MIKLKSTKDPSVHPQTTKFFFHWQLHFTGFKNKGQCKEGVKRKLILGGRWMDGIKITGFTFLKLQRIAGENTIQIFSKIKPDLV